MTIIDNLNLGELIQYREFKKGHVFLKQGYATEGLYIINKGSCQLFSQIPGEKTHIPVAKRHQGDLLAEVSFINGCNMLTSVKALTDIKVTFIPHSVLMGLSEVLPEKALEILTPIVSLICKRIRVSVKNLHQEKLFLPRLGHQQQLLQKKLIKLPFTKIKATLTEHNLLALPIFMQMPKAHLETCIKKLSFYKVKKNQIILEQDKPYDCAYHVLSGALQTFIKCNHGDTKLTIIGPGGTAGLTHFIDKSTSIINCMVREDALIVKISHKDLSTIEKISPLMQQKILLYLYRNVAVTFNKVYMHYLQSKSIHYLF